MQQACISIDPVTTIYRWGHTFEPGGQSEDMKLKNSGLTKIVASATLLLTVYIAIKMPSKTRQEKPAEAGMNTVDASEPGSELAALRRKIEQLEDQLDRRLSRIEQAIERESQSPVEGSPGLTQRDNTDSRPDDRQALVAAVARQMKGQLEAQFDRLAERKSQQNPGGQWKAPMYRLRASLNLSEDAANAANEVFNGGKDETLRLLSMERQDGGSLLSDLVSDIRSGVKDPGQKLLNRIRTESVPGQELSYLTAFAELTETVQSHLGEHLSEDQMDKLKSLNVALLEVDTGYDPIADHVRDQLSR